MPKQLPKDLNYDFGPRDNETKAQAQNRIRWNFIDRVGHNALIEQKDDTNPEWVAQLKSKLHLSESDSHIRTITRMFQVLRMEWPAGFGFTREEVEGWNYVNLRLISYNKWTVGRAYFDKVYAFIGEYGCETFPEFERKFKTRWPQETEANKRRELPVTRVNLEMTGKEAQAFSALMDLAAAKTPYLPDDHARAMTIILREYAAYKSANIPVPKAVSRRKNE